MKTFNLTFAVIFASISLLAGIMCLIQFRIDLGCLALVFGGISYVAYKDYNDPQ